MSAIDTLRRAETRLREVAGKATEGPWSAFPDRYQGDACYSVRAEDHPVGSRTLAITDGDAQGANDATYITLMDPLVGLELAEWLREEALSAKSLWLSYGQGLPGNESAFVSPAALNLARRLLGEEDA